MKTTLLACLLALISSLLAARTLPAVWAATAVASATAAVAAQPPLDAAAAEREERLHLALFSGIALLLLLVVLLFARYRFKTRTARLIEWQNRELEQALGEQRESEQRYRQLFAEPTTARLLLDPARGTVLDANGAAAELLARPLAELLGKTPEAIGSLWLAELIALLRQPGASGLLGSFETLRADASADGTRVPREIEAWASRLYLGGQEVAFVSLQDVTERTKLAREKLRQEERERYIAALEAKTREVETRNAEMERFIYTVSHDLKTPLVTIRGFLGLLERDIAARRSEHIRNDMERIDGAVVRMARLLDELLELSRIGRVVNPPEEVELGELAREAVAQAASAIEERGVAVEIGDRLPVVWGDRPRLFEVFLNLVENAVKFMGEQPQPRLEIGAREQSGETVCFVRDNGIGIEPRYHQKVFGLFDRLDQRVDGTGVGLALTKRIVELHGGRIWVESDGAGTGATFCFTFAGAGAASASAPAAAGAPA